MSTSPDPDPLPDVACGDFYEDCRYHPMVCVELGVDGDEVTGISLITGEIGVCSLRKCGVVLLTPGEAVERRVRWGEFVEANGVTEYASVHYPRDR